MNASTKAQTTKQTSSKRTSGWRQQAWFDIDELQAQIDAAKTVANGQYIVESQKYLEQAKAATNEKQPLGPRISSWWTGSNFEFTQSKLQKAGNALLQVRAHQESPDTDNNGTDASSARSNSLVEDLNINLNPNYSIYARNRSREPLDLKAPTTRSKKHMREAHNASLDLRNLLYVMSLLLLIGNVLIGVVFPGNMRYVFLGALAGALSIVFALVKGSVTMPFNILYPQILLKILAGGISGFLALQILAPTSNQARYAVVFGFSQQAFTQLVDNKAASISAKLSSGKQEE